MVISLVPSEALASSALTGINLGTDMEPLNAAANSIDGEFSSKVNQEVKSKKDSELKSKIEPDIQFKNEFEVESKIENEVDINEKHEKDIEIKPEENLETLKWQVGSIDSIEMQELSGLKVTPDIVVRNKNGDIIDEVYYYVEYKDNDKVGVGKVTVTGRFGYEGSASAEFDIVESLIPPQMKIKNVVTDFGRVRLEFDKVAVGRASIHYEVRLKQLGKEFETSYNFDGADDFAVITGLENNKKYEFKLKAYYINKDGEFIDGPWSDAVVKYTNRYGNKSQKMVQTDITELRLYKYSARTYLKKVTLEDPDLDIHYRIAYRIKGYGEYNYVNVDRLYENFFNLDRGVTYQFCVRYFYYSKVDGKPVYCPYSKVKNGRIGFAVNNVLKVAKSWLGKNERDGSFKSIIDLYNSHRPLARGYKVKYTDEWCATTVSAMFIKAKAVSLPGGTECSVQRYIDIFKKRGVWEEDGRIKPKPGYIICYNWDDSSQKGGNNGWADHIGIVEKVKGNKVTVIEGNYNCKVARRTIPVGWGYIRGYAKLVYPTSSKVW